MNMICKKENLRDIASFNTKMIVLVSRGQTAFPPTALIDWKL